MLELTALFIGVIGCCFGALRGRTGRFGPLLVELLGLLVAAGICAMIGEGKTGGYLAGIVGFLLSMALMALAAGVALGGLLTLPLARGANGRPKAAPPINWDLWFMGFLALMAMAFSAAE